VNNIIEVSSLHKSFKGQRVTHKLPWIAITVSLTQAVLFLGAAAKAIEFRED
jgi:hypothetical protein